MFNASINFLAVIVCGILAFALGFVWYTVIFREPYTADLARTKEWMDAGPSMMVASILQLLGNFVTAYVLAWLIDKTGSAKASGGLKIAFLTWLGFVAAVIGPMYAFQAYSLRFFAIVVGYWLITFLVIGIILSTWRK